MPNRANYDKILLIMRRYEQFEHTADIGVRVWGRDLTELFENAAFALFDTIADLEGLRTTVMKKLTVTAAGREELVVAWLDELLYHFYTSQIIFSSFAVEKLTDTTLEATVKGRPVGENRNRLKTEIKAVTYHDLAITKTDDGYRVDIVLDV